MEGDAAVSILGPKAGSRVRLANLPTPLDELHRLRDALGGPGACPRILVKRDDLTGLATGGSKARKLEFTLAHAMAAGATVLVTTGAVQSNHARLTAAAARVNGLRAVLVLTTDRAHEAPPAPAGNHLLDVLLGAQVHFVPPAPPMAEAGTKPKNPYERERVERLVAELRGQGEVPYVVPLGASDAIGTAGYVAAAVELDGQLSARSTRASRSTWRPAPAARRPDWSSAPGPSEPRGGCTPSPSARATPARRSGPSDSRMPAPSAIGSRVRVDESDFITHQDYMGDNYAIPTAGCQEAIRLVARAEALILDPVYTGKVMAGLIDHVRRGIIPPDQTVVFLHSGGTASVFAQAVQFGLAS